MSQPAPGERFGEYLIVRQLGAGGMGTVWEARHETLQKRVAIKTLNPSVALNPEAVARFVREGQSASKIEHPHIVDITGVGVEDGTPFLVMEYLDGEPLSDLVERHVGGLPVELIADIALPVLDALDCAHNAGVVHRDLKPDNIYLARSRSGDAHPVVLDFGISKVEGPAGAARLTHTSAVMGTPNYMSPEQARGAKHIDARSDQFSLGLVLYEAACGRRAVKGDSILEIIHNITLCEFESLSSLRPELPSPLIAVIERMLAPRAENRFASLREIGRELLPYAGPRAQAVWRSVFGATSGPAGAAPRASAPAVASAGPSTTLGGAAGETLAPLSSSTSAKHTLLAAAAIGLTVTLALVGVVVARVALSGPSASPVSAAETTTTVAPVAVDVPPPQPYASVDLGVQTIPPTARTALEPREEEPGPRRRRSPVTAQTPVVTAARLAPAPVAAVEPASPRQNPEPTAPTHSDQPRVPRVDVDDDTRVGANGAAIMR